MYSWNIDFEQNGSHFASDGHTNRTEPAYSRDDRALLVASGAVALSVPSKRSYNLVPQEQSVLSLSDNEDDGQLEERALKRGRGPLDTSELEIPCICLMSGRAGYENCIKRHKYLSHLARHLHKHDIYVCQMCFTKFDGLGKELNAKRKQEHHCVKICNDGNCKRQQLQNSSHVSPPMTCEHLFTWQERWNELFRAVYPDILPIPALPTPITRAPAQKRQPCIDSIVCDQLATHSDNEWNRNSDILPFACTQIPHQELPRRTQLSAPHSYDTQSTGMARTMSSLTSEHVSTSLKSPLSSYSNAQLEAIHGNATTLDHDLSYSSDHMLDTTGYGASEIQEDSTFDHNLVMTDVQSMEITQSVHEVSIQDLMARVGELEKQCKHEQQRVVTQQSRIETLEAALRRALRRQEEINVELKAASYQGLEQHRSQKPP